MLPPDLARVTEAKVSEIEERIERGRKKIAAWLTLVEALHDVDENAGCKRCGSPHCAGGASCDARWKTNVANMDRLPLAQVLKMTPSRWYALAEIEKAGGYTATIDTDN